MAEERKCPVCSGGKKCRMCNGSGKNGDKDCQICDGTGKCPRCKGRPTGFNLFTHEKS